MCKRHSVTPKKGEKSMEIFQPHPGELQFPGSALIPPGANGDATRVAGQQ